MKADAANRQGEVVYGADMAFVPYEYEEKKSQDISPQGGPQNSDQ
mgnify:CR=1 FL=1